MSAKVQMRSTKELKLSAASIINQLSKLNPNNLNCKKIIALKIAYKIVTFFTDNYPSS